MSADRTSYGEDQTADTAGASSIDRGPGSSNTFINALLGAIVGMVLSLLPFSTVLGGAIAGYLEGGSNDDGFKVGALAGVIMFLPFLLLLYALGAILVFGGAPGVFSAILVFIFVFAALYTIGAGMLGGVIGVYVRREFMQSRQSPDRRPPDRW